MISNSILNKRILQRFYRERVPWGTVPLGRNNNVGAIEDRIQSYPKDRKPLSVSVFDPKVVQICFIPILGG